MWFSHLWFPISVFFRFHFFHKSKNLWYKFCTKHFSCVCCIYGFFKKDFIYLFLEQKGGREGNINVWLTPTRPLLGTWPATQVCALTVYPIRDPLVCRLALNPLSHTSQGSLMNFKYYIHPFFQNITILSETTSCTLPVTTHSLSPLWLLTWFLSLYILIFEIHEIPMELYICIYYFLELFMQNIVWETHPCCDV